MSYIQRYWNENKISHKFNTPIKGLYLKIVRGILTFIRSRKWPSISGTLDSYSIAIEESKWLKGEGGSVYLNYGYCIVSYSVQGKKYSKTEKTGGFSEEEGVVQYIQARYLDRDILVYYNPKNPSHSRIVSVEREENSD
ncbi:MAG: DUF3592 domain-containing protein [Candidatus Hodarchaeales archaeon]